MSVIKTQQTDSCVMSFISLETSNMSHLHLQTVSQNNTGSLLLERPNPHFYKSGGMEKIHIFYLF